jgi:transposase InsO family protein
MAPPGQCREGAWQVRAIHDRLRGQRLARREQARRAVMDWMAFYNHPWLHSALGYSSLMQFEKRRLAAQHEPAA